MLSSGCRQKIYSPLEQVSFSGLPEGQVEALDGEGERYWSGTVSESAISFLAGGALGNHTILVKDDENRLIETLSFIVDAKTDIRDSNKIFYPLFKDLYLTMITSCGGDGAQTIMVEEKLYSYFICWLRDHTHTMKGMKYFYEELKTGLELYADTQRSDGMIYDRIRQKQSDAQGWRDYTFREGDFVRNVYSGSDGTGVPYTLQRIPVENDVEFLYLECLYYTWKATGDTSWMSRYLDSAIAAVRYATGDRYRWSEKFGLLKRGYTIDTWDFMHHDDAALTPGENVCDAEKTSFGVMFGDNTGMAAGCRYLAEMLRAADRKDEAPEFDNIASELLERLGKISWNGEFYTHHVSEDPSFRRDVGNTDEKAQVTLSNAYSVNRMIGEDKAKAIIARYKRLRQEMPENSPGEFYNCYPPFEKGFGTHDRMWQYMNGGVSSIVAGELARGAFRFGEEVYAVDILKRVKELADRHEGHLHVCFNGNPRTSAPERNFTLIDIADLADVTTAYRVEGGWGDKGNDLSRLPEGRQVYGEVPFKTLGAGTGIAGNTPGYAKQVRIPVDGEYASIYLHHTMSGGDIAARMKLVYEDGESGEIFLKNKGQLESWFMPESGEIKHVSHAPKMRMGWPEYQLAWRGANDTFDNVGTYIWGWNNPRPEKKIKEIVFDAMEKNTSYLLLGVTACDKPVWFPQSDLSFGIPDGWGAAAVVYAIVEGLAGIVDTGVAFDSVEISPRWSFADEKSAKAVVKYPASGAYVAYTWEETGKALSMLLSSSAKNTVVRIPIPEKGDPDIKLDGIKVDWERETAGATDYASFAVTGKGVFKIELHADTFFTREEK